MVGLEDSCTLISLFHKIEISIITITPRIVGARIAESDRIVDPLLASGKVRFSNPRTHFAAPEKSAFKILISLHIVIHVVRRKYTLTVDPLLAPKI